MTFLLILAAITLLLYVMAAIQITRGSFQLESLERFPPIPPSNPPRVSIIIPACNEERHIETALSSVLALDYPDFEVIAVNDRSTDSTGAIIDRMAERVPFLRAVHIRELPSGWLGKNHALQQGARQATGFVLLFTDADVVMESSALSRAVNYLEQRSLDHLAVPPRAIVGGFLANVYLGAFALLFSLYAKPWKVRDPKSREYIGIGAFNLVRQSAYWAVGGHQPIAMRPDDDMRLGKLLKSRGHKQDMVFGTKLLTVEWYASFTEMRNGLMKNLFAGVDYSITLVILSSILQVAVLIWPFVALFATRGLTQATNAAAVSTMLLAFFINSRMVGIRWWWGLTMPLAAVISIYLMVRAMTVALWNGGIEWRGTKYPLDQLRANRF